MNLYFIQVKTAIDAEAENNYRQIIDKAWQAIDRSFVGENYNTQAGLQV